MKSNIVLTVLLQILWLSDSVCQKNITNQNLYWTRFFNQWAINERFTLHSEFENRRFWTPNTQHHFITHNHLHYRVSKNFDAALGYTYSIQSPQIPDGRSNLVVPEHRPFQEFNYTNPINTKLVFGQRLRIDERFFRKNNGKELLDGYDFNFRFRYRLQISYILNNKSKQTKDIIKFSDELMINAGKRIVNNIFDQNRISVAWEHNINKNWSAEVSYINWFQQRSSGVDFFNRDITRLTIFHKMGKHR